MRAQSASGHEAADIIDENYGNSVTFGRGVGKSRDSYIEVEEESSSRIDAPHGNAKENVPAR